VLDSGRILMTGTVAEVRGSDNARVQDLLNRRPRRDPIDADAYLERLTEGQV
jgi:phospholipid/cholesterol/gamma-HCH transport system ATP-binding protein